MGFREIKAEEKVQAVFEVLHGAKIIGVASKYGVNRDSLSDWVKFETFVLRNNLRVFQRGKRKGYSPLQLEGIQTKITDWTDLIWGENPEEALKEIEVSALIRNLQDQKGTDRHNEPGSISSPKTGQERRGETGLAREELPFRIGREVLNKCIEGEN